MITSVTKVLDIDGKELLGSTVMYLLNEPGPAYRDQILKEHLYDIPGLIDELSGDEDDQCIHPSPEAMKEIEKINKIMIKRGCAYLRIIFG